MARLSGGEEGRSNWAGLACKVGKSALVLLLLTAFAQWYLPNKDHLLGARPDHPREWWSKEKILLRERLDWREMLNDPEEPYKGIIWNNGMRRSHPMPCAPRPKHVLVVGCSCTWGLGVNDRDTYVWKLNELVPDTEFDNAGMVGYGPYRCIDAIQHYMSQKHYDLVIYSAIGNHMFRDARWYDERIEVTGRVGKKVPRCYLRSMSFVRAYCELGSPTKDGQLPPLEYYDLHKVHWFLDDRIHLINFIKELSMHLRGRWETWRYDKQENDPNIDIHNQIALRLRLIINDMDKTVRARGAKFVLVSLDGVVNEFVNSHLMDGKQYKELQPRFPYVEVTYPQDFHTTEGLHTPASKFDNGDHPIPAIHTYYARKIAEFLKSVKY